jgi:hypothetical protein
MINIFSVRRPITVILLCIKYRVRVSDKELSLDPNSVNFIKITSIFGN